MFSRLTIYVGANTASGGIAAKKTKETRSSVCSQAPLGDCRCRAKRMCERRHREPHDTIILLPGFTASSYIAAGSRYRAAVLTSVPTMIAMTSFLPPPTISIH